MLYTHHIIRTYTQKHTAAAYVEERAVLDEAQQAPDALARRLPFSHFDSIL